MMDPVLFDSSLYVTWLRMGNDARPSGRHIAAGHPLWLSSVVLEELYAGARTKDRRVLSRLERDFDKVRRILTPNLNDWTQTGKVLAQLAARYGYEWVERRRLTNDALIAVSAGRSGITVITANARDFGRLAEFRSFQWRVDSPQPTAAGANGY